MFVCLCLLLLLLLLLLIYTQAHTGTHARKEETLIALALTEHIHIRDSLFDSVCNVRTQCEWLARLVTFSARALKLLYICTHTHTATD